MLDGVDIPATAELRERFNHGGVDRVSQLNDPAVINPRQRPLAAAIANARLQSAALVDDILAHTPASPTVYVVASCATLNRQSNDTELFCGLAVADTRSDELEAVYIGLGDRPDRYRFHEDERMSVTEG
jgi:hypothetical protein